MQAEASDRVSKVRLRYSAAKRKDAAIHPRHRSKFWRDLSLPFYGYNKPGVVISEGVRDAFWLQGMMAGLPASYFCISAFSEADQI